MRVIIACGGTGGHVYPGVATGQVLQSAGHEVHLWLAGKSIEKKTITSWSGPVTVIATDWDQSRTPAAFFGTGFRLFKAWLDCRKQLRHLRPAALLAMGSRASLIPVAAARSLGIPVVLHESNVMPGRAILLLTRFFKVTVALGFAETAERLPGHLTPTVTGFPLRDLAPRGPLPDFPPGDAPAILVMGGSQGSTKTNQLACDALIRLHREGLPFRVIHLAGAKQEDSIRADYRAAGVPAVVYGYLQDMGAAYAAASLAISRAGAASCAELAFFGVPALYIPYPYAGNHQRLNALAMEKAGAALTRSQDALSVEGLAERLGLLLRTPAELDRMREAARKAATPDAAQRLASLILATAEKSKPMMPLVDTHAHLDGLAQDAPAAIEQALARALANGVIRLIAVGGNPEGNRIALQSARTWPDLVSAAAGFDRYCAGRADLDESELIAQLDSPGIAAVGETGLDFHYAADSAEPQKKLFRRMLDLAADRRLPIVVHCRNSEEAMGPMLEEHAARWRGDPLRIGVIHCFTGSPAFAQRAVACGFHISFSGILTFPKADNVRTAALAVPEDRLLVETDTPYLAPVPHRGKPNEPQWVELVLRELARVRQVDPAHLAAITTANAFRLFGLG